MYEMLASSQSGEDASKILTWEKVFRFEFGLMIEEDERFFSGQYRIVVVMRNASVKMF